MFGVIGRAFKLIMLTVLIAVVSLLALVYFMGDYSAYIVKSDSMSPTIKSGDMVFIGHPNRPLVDEIAPGKIITFQRHGELVTHRVISVEGDTLYTRGDALEETDPWTVSRFFDVEGCYMFHVPYAGLISTFIKTKTGWFVCVILPAVFLIGLIVREIIKEARRNFLFHPVKRKSY